MRRRFIIKQPDPIPFTKAGYEEKKAAYEKLLAERPAAVADLKKAREMGDLSENGYYKSARWKLSEVDRQLRHMRYLLQYGKVIEGGTPDVVGINTTVTVNDGKTYQTYFIVGDYEADPKERKISQNSPLGSALLGKKTGEEVRFQTRLGERKLKIVHVQH